MGYAELFWGTVILCGLGFGILAILGGAPKRIRWGFEGAFFGSLAGMLAGCVLCGIVGAFFHSLAPRENFTVIETATLVALVDGRGASSSFGGAVFLGTGFIGGSGETQDYYYFRRQDTDGGSWMDKVPAVGSGVKTYEHDTHDAPDARLEIHRFGRRTNPSWRWIGWTGIDEIYTRTEYRFYVPKGTIKRIIELDLQ